MRPHYTNMLLQFEVTVPGQEGTHIYWSSKHVWREGVQFCKTPYLKKASSKLWIQPKKDRWEGSMSGFSFKGSGNVQMLEGSGRTIHKHQWPSKQAGPLSKHHDCGVLLLFLCKSAACFLGRYSAHPRAPVSTDSRHPLHGRGGYLYVGQSAYPACSTNHHCLCIFMPSDACY